MEFGHVEIFVNDPLKARDFYEQILGFEVVEVQNNTFVWMKYSDQQFLLRPGEKEIQPNEYKDSDIGFVFYTNNLEQTKNNLLLKGLQFKGTDGADTCLTFSDPDGNWFQLVDPNHT